MHRIVGNVVLDVAELSDPGREPSKQINEDACAYVESSFGHLLVLCDGMGGHTHGREASHTAIRIILSTVEDAPLDIAPRTLLAQAVEAAGRAVYEVGGREATESRPGTTCIVALVSDDGAYTAHVGDSRVYLIRSGAIHRVTKDHSIVQDLLDSGAISPDEARDHPESNKITRALGMTEDVQVDVSERIPLHPGDALLLCSDGLSDLATDDEISSVVQMNLPSGAEVPCERLVNLANLRGGWDNITVQIAHVVEVPDADDATAPDEVPPFGPTGTVVLDDGLRPGPLAPTLADEPAQAPAALTVDDPRERVATAPLLDGPAPTVLDTDAPFGEGAASPRSTRWLLGVAGAVAFAIVLAVAGWALLGRRAATPGPSPSGELFPGADVPPPDQPAGSGAR